MVFSSSAVPSENLDPTDPGQELAPPNPAGQATDITEQLNQRIELLKADKAAQGQKNAQLNERLRSLESELAQLRKGSDTSSNPVSPEGGDPALRQQLAEAREANKALQKEIRDLKKVNSDLTASVEKDKFRSTAREVIAKQADVINPDQMLMLLEAQGMLSKSESGRPIVLSGGVEHELPDYLRTEMKAPGSGWEHFFRAPGGQGMGASAQMPSAATTAASENPYITGNLTTRILLETQDPERARALQQEANRLAAARK